MILSKNLRNSIVRVTTEEFGNGWTVEVMVDDKIVHDRDSDMYATEEEAFFAGEEFAKVAVPPLH